MQKLMVHIHQVLVHERVVALDLAAEAALERAAQLLDIARKYPDFPIVLETVRECLQDVYDVPTLTELMARIAQRRVRVLEVETQTPSPFAASLLFGYVGAFMYEGDSPLAERRAAVHDR